MSPLAWLAGAALALGLAAVTGVVSDEARARFDRIPYGLLCVAVRRLPREIRADVGEEWRAELDHILHRVQAYPLTRLLYGTWFAIGLLRAAPAVGKNLISTRGGSREEERPRKSAAERASAALAALTQSGTPRMRIWRLRLAIALTTGVTMAVILHDWRWGLTMAVMAAIAHTIYRSRIVLTAQSPASAQTVRLLSRLRRSQYICLHNLAIPGTGERIDHLIVGPGGICILTSQRWDRRLPARAKPAEGQLYHGPASQAEVLEDARRRAARAAELIGAELGARIEIRPGVLILGPRLFHNAVPAKDVIQLRGVDVFGPRAARRWLNRGQGTIPAAEREELAAAIGRILAYQPALTAALEGEATLNGAP
jgi:hypothetical protein